MPLTDSQVRNLKPPATGTTTVWDAQNFGVRVSHGGTKTWIVMLGKGRRHTIGHYPLLSLADARKEARRILAEKELGKVRPRFVSWDTAITTYLARCEQENRPLTVRDYRRILTKRFAFGTKALADITAHDILAKLNGLPIQEKHHAFTAGRSFLRWCVRQHYIEQTPTERMETPPQNKPRERVLADHELQALWQATEPPGAFHAIVRLLILTGQRRGEVARFEWSWFADDLCTIPSSVTKNGRTHTFPLSPKAQALIVELPRLKDNPFLFPAHRHMSASTSVFNGWSKGKADLDRRLPIEPWTLHDLRRTFASGMASLGVPQIVVEKLLNHVSGGTQSPIAQVYNRYSYLPEMRAAVLQWDDHLDTLITPGALS